MANRSPTSYTVNCSATVIPLTGRCDGRGGRRYVAVVMLPVLERGSGRLVRVILTPKEVLPNNPITAVNTGEVSHAHPPHWSLRRAG